MGYALLGGGLGLAWLTTVIIWLVQRARDKRTIAEMREAHARLSKDTTDRIIAMSSKITRLEDHVDYQVGLIEKLHQAWKQDREQLLAALDASRKANAHALEAIRTLLATAPPSVAGAAVLQQLNAGFADAAAPAAGQGAVAGEITTVPGGPPAADPAPGDGRAG